MGSTEGYKYGRQVKCNTLSLFLHIYQFPTGYGPSKLCIYVYGLLVSIVQVVSKTNIEKVGLICVVFFTDLVRCHWYFWTCVWSVFAACLLRYFTSGFA